MSLSLSLSRLASASTPTPTTFPSLKIESRRRPYINPCHSALMSSSQLCSSDLSLRSTVSFVGAKVTERSRIVCRSSTGPGSGDNESRNVLDAFFLGKALAEAVNERVESVIGEVLSAVGRIQAEQQKQVQDFQEEVLERAKRAKEKAAREAMEAQGLIPKSTAASATSVTNGAASKTSSPSIANDRSSVNSSSYSTTTPSAANTDPGPGPAEIE